MRDVIFSQLQSKISVLGIGFLRTMSKLFSKGKKKTIKAMGDKRAQVRVLERDRETKK